MSAERKWRNLEVYYEDGTTIAISRQELEKLEAIYDVVNAIEKARGWAMRFKHLV